MNYCQTNIIIIRRSRGVFESNTPLPSQGKVALQHILLNIWRIRRCVSNRRILSSIWISNLNTIYKYLQLGVYFSKKIENSFFQNQWDYLPLNTGSRIQLFLLMETLYPLLMWLIHMVHFKTRQQFKKNLSYLFLYGNLSQHFFIGWYPLIFSVLNQSCVVGAGSNN